MRTRSWQAGLHLWVAWSLAVAGPVLDRLGRDEGFFAARGSGGGDIVALALGLSLLPALVLWGVVALAARVRPAAGEALLAALIGALVGIWLVPVVDLVPGLDGVAVLIGALALGTLAGVAYARRPATRALATALAIAPVAFLLVFLLVSPVSRTVLPGAEARGAPAALPSRTPVVLVVFDELPLTSLTEGRDRIDAGRFPHFGALARESTWYPEASSVSGSTLYAVPAILDGRRPRRHALPDADDHPSSLFTLLGRSHRIVDAEPLTDLCPDRLCGPDRDDMGRRLRDLADDTGAVALHVAAPAGLRRPLPPLTRATRRYGRAITGDVHIPRTLFDDRVTKVEQALDKLRRPGGRPPLAVLHAVLPHEPWTLLPDGSEYPVSGDSIVGLRDDVLARDPELSRQALQRHLLQLGYVDRVLGEIEARLRATGLWDRSLVVVAADHGAGFRPGGNRRRVTREDAAELAAVPLLIKRPGQRRGRVDRHPVQTSDVTPTIAAALGLSLPWRAEGRPTGTRRLDQPVRIVGPERSGAPFASVTLSRATFDRDRRAAGRRVARWFGTGSWRGVYASGPRPDLLGRRVPAGRPRAGGAVSVEGASGLASVRRSSGVLPVYVTGRVDDGDRTPLALALGGRVVATTRPYRDQGELRFSAVLPPAAMREGSNELDVLRPRGARLRLLARAGARSAYSLTGQPGRPRLRHDGRPVREAGGQLRGEIDQAEVSDRVLRLGGWAADVGPHGRPARAVAVFAGSRLLFAGATTKRRPDVTGAFHAPVLRSGFRFTVARDDLLGTDGRPAPLRAFALGARGATPLAVTGQAATVLARRGLRRSAVAGRGVLGLDGRAVAVVAGSGSGELEAVAVRRHTLALTGWALAADGRPAGTLVALAGGHVLAVGAPSLPRDDLSGRSGFDLEVDRRAVRGRPPVHVLAIGPAGATELSLSPDARRALEGAAG